MNKWTERADDPEAYALMDRVVAAMAEGNPCPTHTTVMVAIQAACMLLMSATGLSDEDQERRLLRLVNATKRALVKEADSLISECYEKDATSGKSD